MDRIETLQEKAAERYLNGDYQAAIAAWKEILDLDPSNEQALEGLRMSEILGDEDWTEAPAESPPRAREEPHSPDLEAEIDEGLSVLDDLMSPARPPAGAQADPSRQGEGIDLGEVGDLAAIPLASPGSGAAEQDEAADAVGLDFVGDPRRPSTGTGEEPASVAQDALARRVQDLLAQARDLRDGGDREAALAVVGRIYILDETSEEARALEAELRDQGAGDLAEIESWLTEGVQAFDQDRLDEAKDFFTKVNDRVPNHREAVHYLEAIVERQADQSKLPQDFLADSGAAGVPLDIPLDLPPAREAPRPASLDEPGPLAAGRANRPAPGPLEVPTTPARRLALPKWAIPAGVGVVAVALGIVFLPGLLGPGAKNSDAPGEPAPARRTAGGVRPRPVLPAPAPAPESTTATPSAATAAPALAKGRDAMARGDYGAAVLAFNEALAIDAVNEEALSGLHQAGELYKAGKAEREQVERVRIAFRDGEFASALRVLYRLPASFDQATVEKGKIAGWFNLGVVALRAGETRQAVSHFDEALSIRPDADVTKWKAYAQRYRNLPKDRTFYATVEAIPFRSVD